jgi:Asp/Glu/hydantoin racemase
LGYSQGQLAGVHTVVQTGAELARDPVAAQAILTQACNDAAASTGAAAVILGGAGLAGMAQDLQSGVPVPVIDSVSAGVQNVMDLCGRPVVAQPLAFGWSHVSPELAATGTPT